MLKEEKEEKEWIKNWEKNIVFSNGTHNRNGVAILISHNCEVDIYEKKSQIMMEE